MMPQTAILAWRQAARCNAVLGGMLPASEIGGKRSLHHSGQRDIGILEGVALPMESLKMVAWGPKE